MRGKAQQHSMEAFSQPSVKLWIDKVGSNRGGPVQRLNSSFQSHWQEQVRQENQKSCESHCKTLDSALSLIGAHC